MKTYFLLINTIMALLLISCKVSAQATATAGANATIITPITIVKNVEMNIGNVAVSASTAGTVVLSPGGARTTGGAGGVTLPSTSGTVSGADFTVSGQASYAFAITLPSLATISNGSNTMMMTSFTSSPALTGALSSSGLQDLRVGATLNVVAGQPAGTYTNATAVPVTVNYN